MYRPREDIALLRKHFFKPSVRPDRNCSIVSAGRKRDCYRLLVLEQRILVIDDQPGPSSGTVLEWGRHSDDSATVEIRSSSAVCGRTHSSRSSVPYCSSNRSVSRWKPNASLRHARSSVIGQYSPLCRPSPRSCNRERGGPTDPLEMPVRSAISVPFQAQYL